MSKESLMARLNICEGCIGQDLVVSGITQIAIICKEARFGIHKEQKVFLSLIHIICLILGRQPMVPTQWFDGIVVS